jgi:hypothetical protein
MTTPSKELTLQPTQEPSVALMLSGFIDRGITAENVAAFSQLVTLKERMDDKQAQKDFASALVDLQGETIRVQATKAVDQKADGTCRYRFAPYEEIMAVVQPMLTRHGFSITFDTKIEETRLSSICTLTHKSGHSRSNSFAVRYGKPPGSSDAQGDMATKSYAKRGALCDALNISIEHDTDGDDARNEGGPVTQQQADELRDLCDETKSDRAKFLAFAGASKFEEISANRLSELKEVLVRRLKK